MFVLRLPETAIYRSTLIPIINKLKIARMVPIVRNVPSVPKTDEVIAQMSLTCFLQFKHEKQIEEFLC